MNQPAQQTTSISPPAVNDSLYLDNQLCVALYTASLAMTRTYRPMLTALGLTYPQYVVMLALWEHKELSAGALGKLISLDSGTLVPLVRRLCALGLVDRNRNPEDDRSVLISLTPPGAAMQQQMYAVQDVVSCATDCSAAQRQELARSLQTLRASLLQNLP